MHRVRLESQERERLRALSRSPGLSARARERLEMLLLSDGGWSPPRIGEHLDRHADTGRRLVQEYKARGEAALHPEPPGPEPDAERRAQVESALDKLLGEDRTWTSRQLAAALEGEGVASGWERAVEARAGEFLYLAAQLRCRGRVEVAIYRNGRLLKEGSAAGDRAAAEVSGTY